MLFYTINIQQGHFTAEMWEKPRVDGKKKLKNTVVPTIFQHQNKNIIASVSANNIGFASSNVSLTLFLTKYILLICMSFLLQLIIWFGFIYYRQKII